MKNSEVGDLITKKGAFAESENLRIYKTYFYDWVKYNGYIYKKFNILFEKRILDIGSSYGHNLIHFAKDSVGIEANHNLVIFSRGLGLNVVEGNIEDSLPTSERFDLVWCTDFLVHLVSPYKFLYDCRKLLNTGGRIVIQIPLMSMLNNHKSPCHLYAFNKKSLIYLLETAGYKIIKTSGCIRKMPNLFNYLLEPVLQVMGGNIWILAEKKEDKFNFEKSFLPAWFTR
jgi:SAM-dependent methyltransferase